MAGEIIGRRVESFSRETLQGLGIYRRGIVRISEDGKSLINNLTGKTYSTLKDAIVGTRKYGTAEAVVLGGIEGILSPDDPQYAVLSQFAREINTYLRLPDAQSHVASSDLLTRLSNKNLEIVRLGFSEDDKNVLQTIAALSQDRIDPEKLVSGEALPPGLLNVQKGTALIQFRYLEGGEYKYLTGEESLSLTSLLGADFFDTNKLVKALNPNMLTASEAKVGALMQKAAKRNKTFTSDRNFALTGLEIDSLVEKMAATHNAAHPMYKAGAPVGFEDTFLFFSPELETTLKAFGLTEEYEKALKGSLKGTELAALQRERTATNILMEGQSQAGSQQYFRDSLKLMGHDSEQTFNEFESLVQGEIRSQIKDQGKVSLEDLAKKIRGLADSATDETVKSKFRAFETVLSEMEKIDDGSGFMLGSPLRHKAETLRGQINQARERLSGLKSGREFDILSGNVKEWESNLDRIVSNSKQFLNGGDARLRHFQDNIARIVIGRGQGKTFLDLVDDTGAAVTSKAYRLGQLGYWGAGSHALNKGEVSFARILAPGSDGLGPNAGQALTMNLVVGETPDRVYSDIQGMIFHRDEYLGAQEQITRNVDQLEKEINLIMKEGKISHSVRQTIARDAAIDLDAWQQMELPSRRAAERMKAQAMELQQTLMRGDIKVNEIPDLANKLLRYAQRSTFRERGSYKVYEGGSVREVPLLHALMPYSQRSGVDTEGRVSRGLGDKILGEKVSALRALKTEHGDLNLFNFRFDDHKMIIPDSAGANIFGMYQAGGGFDLDDKFITNLHYIKDTEGNRHLAAFAWRQPTGPQEFALMTPHLDEGTIKRLFGSDTQMGEKFRNLSYGINDLIDSGAAEGLSDREIKIFKYIDALANGKTKAANTFKPESLQQEEIEKALFRIFDIGGNDRVRLSDTVQSMSIDDFATTYLGGGAQGAKGAQGAFLNDITEVNSNIIKLAMSTKAGAPLALNEKEIISLARDNKNFAVQYRRNQLTQLMEGKTILPEDEFFQEEIEQIWAEARTGKTYNQFRKDLLKDLKKQKITRDLSEAEVAQRAAGVLINGRSTTDPIYLEAKDAVGKFFQRMQVTSLSAEDGLGKYVNRLGWLASSGDQRLAAAENMLKYAEETKNEDLIRIANELVSKSYLVWNPEKAIDAAIGLGSTGLAVSYQDLLASHVLASGHLTPELAQQSLNNSLYSLFGRDATTMSEFSVQIKNYLTKTKTKSSLYAELQGKSVGEIYEILNSNKELHKQIFEDLIRSKDVDIMKHIQASTEVLGGTNIEEVSSAIAKTRAYQLAFPGSVSEEVGLAGIDRITTAIKLSEISNEKEGIISDVRRSVTSTVDELKRSIQQIKLMKGYDAAGLAAVEDLATKLSGLDSIKDDVSLRTQFIRLMGFEDKIQERYGAASFGEQLRRAQNLLETAKTKLRAQKFNQFEAFRDVLAGSDFDATMRSLKADIRNSLQTEQKTTLENLMLKSELLQAVKREGIDGRFNEKSFLFQQLERTGIKTKEELIAIKKAKSWQSLVHDVENSVSAELSEAQGTISRSIQKMFEQAVLPESKVGPLDLMKKLLLEMGDLKNATKTGGKLTLAQREQSFLGSAIESALSGTDLTFRVKDLDISIQGLQNYVRQEMLVRQTESVEGQLDNLTRVIQELAGDTAHNEFLTTGTIKNGKAVVTENSNLLDNDLIGRLFKFDMDKATSPTSSRLGHLNLTEESGSLLDEVLSRVTGGTIDRQFVEDFAALSSSSLNAEEAEASIRRRYIEEARMKLDPNVPLQQAYEEAGAVTAAEVEAERRINLIRQIKTRYAAKRELQTGEELAVIRAALPSIETERTDQVLIPLVDVIDQLWKEHGDRAVATKLVTSEEEAAVRASFQETISQPGKYTRVGDAIRALFDKSKPLAERGSLGDFADGLLRNKSTIIGAAAIATGLAVIGHVTSKREHTKDSIAGPPLLPGGNPYERLPQFPLQNPNIDMGQNDQGVGYDVSINGDEEQTNEFMARAGMLTNGQVTGTMRNSLPQLGRNHYDAIAGSF